MEQAQIPTEAMLELCEGILQDIHSLLIHSRNPQSSIGLSDTSPFPHPSAPDRRPNMPSIEEGVTPTVSPSTCRLPPLLSCYEDTIRPDVGEADSPSKCKPGFSERLEDTVETHESTPYTSYYAPTKASFKR